jgi:DNA-binding PadR family transcriptional regulator
MASVSARELFILGRVSLRPTHGHEIMRTLRESRADLWIELSEKHVYYILKKLEREGSVTSSEQRTGNLPSRKVFTVTDAGKVALAEMMSAGDLTDAIPYSEFDVLLGMLSYTDVLDDAAKAEVLDRRRAALETVLRDAHRERENGIGVGGFPTVILERVISRLTDEMGWLDSIRTRVERDGWSSMTPTFETPADVPRTDRSLVPGVAGAPSTPGRN